MKRIAATAAAVASLVAAAFLAVNHPLAPLGTLAAAVAVAALAWRFPAFGDVSLPATLPWLALAPYTGAIACEEVDILVLALAAGGYARRAGSGDPARAARVQDPARNVALLIMALLCVSWSVALARGLAGAEVVGLGWFQGYLEPANALRIGKSMLLAVWLVPLWHARSSASGTVPGIRFAVGMSAGLLVACVLVVTERLAFTGLTNFSTDYRATGPFWEMHVGGAALDGYLALASPFAVWLGLHERRPLALAAIAGIIGVAYYAALVTFSRGVYLALPLGMAVLVAMHLRQRQSVAPLPLGRILLFGGMAIAAWSVAAGVVFRHGGYRTLAATLGVLAALLALGSAHRAMPVREAMRAALLGTAVGAGAILVGSWLPKGPYVLYALIFAWNAWWATRQRQAGGRAAGTCAVGGAIALAMAAVAVARHWGGVPAAIDASIVLVLMLGYAAWHVLGARARLPLERPTQALALLGAVAVAGIVAVFGGGQYMSERVAQGRHDLAARMQHWSGVVASLADPVDWVVGRGFGTFPAAFVFSGLAPLPGTADVVRQREDAYLALGGPGVSGGFGDMLKVGQWTTVLPGVYGVSLRARAPRGTADLHVELCERHLLYNGECAIGKVSLQPGSQWRTLDFRLNASALGRGSWYAPRGAFFALAVETPAGRVDIDHVSVTGPQGEQKIANGAFTGDFARWFPLSERLHLPWHTKNLALHVLFEQGVFGLLLLTLLVACALWRLVAGRMRNHSLAPALAASLAGFLVVGVFDSLLDVPRVALLFWLLTFVAVTLPAERPPPRGGAATLRA